ncbi:pyridoxamine 5'-phosphate oxidase family protein [Oceanospirillum sp. D5]|uniref:Pyridoxamine 5'-phosphate oxidase family protein n=2 Tax=Oceanospirillum sediminis TaxID=2760088 RepID=A0A839ILR2_9GAMM|nr:pyridoxamine 5'-phosphate oxidase family protein [Oceanospirillum sediminis]
MKIETEEQLRALYGYPVGRAKQKQLPALEQHSRRFIHTSPFAVISTCNIHGQVDASPRGGQPGFIHVLDDNTLLIPDAKGNNRLDSLVNIVENGQIGCLFMIPGVNETLRVNGEAFVCTDDEYLDRFVQGDSATEKHRPQSVIQVKVKEVFLHCAKAFMRSRLWSADARIERSDFPTMGQMLNDQLGDAAKPESQQEMEARYLASL